MFGSGYFGNGYFGAYFGPEEEEAATQGGYRSFMAFWMGGASAATGVTPPASTAARIVSLVHAGHLMTKYGGS